MFFQQLAHRIPQESGVPTPGVCWNPMRSYRLKNFTFSAVAPRSGTQDSNPVAVDWHTGYLECGHVHTVYRALRPGYQIRIWCGVHGSFITSTFLQDYHFK
jgi:hypothetical protein